MIRGSLLVYGTATLPEGQCSFPFYNCTVCTKMHVPASRNLMSSHRTEMDSSTVYSSVPVNVFKRDARRIHKCVRDVSTVK